MLATARAQSGAAQLWDELAAKREKLAGFHQEFDVSQTYKTSQATQNLKRQVMLDVSGRQWREKSISGSGNYLRIFDGQDLLRMEEAGEEYVREKRRSKDPDPVAAPYNSSDAELSKLREVERLPCGVHGRDHECVVFEIPLNPRVRPAGASSAVRMVHGVRRSMFDVENGLLISVRTVQLMERSTGRYQMDVLYNVKRNVYGEPLDASLFALPTGVREVKELSSWDVRRIRKQLLGKAAPDLAATDLEGKPISLADFKGKTVLLDFWTTWCPPCRADHPALDKLFLKYGANDLVIVGISVSEEHSVVEKFLQGHSHAFPVVLTSENEMPRPYQIHVFPTYIVIGADGTLEAAVEGDQGFGDLRKLLKKAGLDAE